MRPKTAGPSWVHGDPYPDLERPMSSSIIHSQAADIPYAMTTTGFELAGHRIVENMGVVRGVVVRSRSVVGTIGAGLQTLFGGNISLFTELAERTRQQAFDTMLVQADMAGADAVIG